MRQFLVRTLDKEFKVNASRMYIENDWIYFESKIGGDWVCVAVFAEPEYAYELAEGKDVVIYGIMDIESRYAKVISGSTNLGEEN